MAQNRRLLVAIVLVAALGIVARFALTSVEPCNEVYYESGPDELPSFVAVEGYVCPKCEAEIREAYKYRHSRKPSEALPAGIDLVYEKPTENGFCKIHPDTKLEARRDLPVDPRVTEGLPAETEYINRQYVEKGAPPGSVKPIQLTAVISQHDRQSIHRPESCLYSQGWSPTVPPAKLVLPCPALPSGEIVVRQLLMQQSVKGEDGRQFVYGLVVHTWYAAPPDRLTATEISYLFRMFYDRLINGINYRWSSVLISRQVLPGQSPDVVSGQVKQFVQEFAEWAEEQRAEGWRSGE